MLRAAAAPPCRTGSHLQVFKTAKNKRPHNDMPLLQYPVAGQRPAAHTRAQVQTNSFTWPHKAPGKRTAQQPERATVALEEATPT